MVNNFGLGINRIDQGKSQSYQISKSDRRLALDKERSHIAILSVNPCNTW